jgi:antitoxin CcdA
MPAETKRLDINISETGMREHADATRRERWLEQNREAIEDYNARIERNGLTLARYRQF